MTRTGRLYLVRHAEAAAGEPDELRALTEEGRRAARSLGERLRERGDVAAVRTSPLLRARQTGDAIARAVGVDSAPDERLAPGATAEGVAALLDDCEQGAVVAVGHQPDCGEIAAALTGGAPPPFPPAGCVTIDL